MSKNYKTSKVRKGKLHRTRDVKKNKKKLVQEVGKVQMTREGFAFVIVEGQDDDIYVKASKTRHALDGDIVRVAVTREKFGGARNYAGQKKPFPQA